MAGNVKRNRNEDSSKKTIRILAAVMGMLAIVYFLPAFMQRTDTISGHNREGVYRSAVKVKSIWPRMIVSLLTRHSVCWIK